MIHYLSKPIYGSRPSIHKYKKASGQKLAMCTFLVRSPWCKSKGLMIANVVPRDDLH